MLARKGSVSAASVKSVIGRSVVDAELLVGESSLADDEADDNACRKNNYRAKDEEENGAEADFFASAAVVDLLRSGCSAEVVVGIASVFAGAVVAAADVDDVESLVACVGNSEDTVFLVAVLVKTCNALDFERERLAVGSNTCSDNEL